MPPFQLGLLLGIVFALGLFIGCNLGVLLMCLLQVASDG